VPLTPVIDRLLNDSTNWPPSSTPREKILLPLGSVAWRSTRTPSVLAHVPTPEALMMKLLTGVPPRSVVWICATAPCAEPEAGTTRTMYAARPPFW
jgi:hypothetical protein